MNKRGRGVERARQPYLCAETLNLARAKSNGGASKSCKQ